MCVHVCVCEGCALVFDFFHCDFLTPLFYADMTEDTEQPHVYVDCGVSDIVKYK